VVVLTHGGFNTLRMVVLTHGGFNTLRMVVLTHWAWWFFKAWWFQRTAHCGFNTLRF
jgi:hypothetical protein